MRLLDLFSGLGGFSLAGHRVGMNTVAFSEIEKFPCRVLAERFPGVPNLGDIAKIDGEEVVEKYGPVDIVTFGSPCQDLSVAGKRAGFAGERSGLFHEAIRVIAGTRPAFAVWENVPGAMSSNRGRDFGAALNALADIGALDIAWRVLDAKYCGVPQRRRRVFVVADFRRFRASEILLESESVQRNLEAGRAAGKEIAGGVGGGAPFTFDERNVTSRVNRTRVGPGLPCGTLHEQPMSVVEPNQVPTLNSGMAVRRLTPLEAERLQGYPDGWTNLRGAADGPRYRALGNSVAVPVIEWILGRAATAVRMLELAEEAK